MDRPIPVMNWLLGCEHHLDSRPEEELNGDIGTHAEEEGRKRVKSDGR